VAEGVIVREGSVLGMGVYLGQSTPIINRETGETIYGEVPPYSVIVSGGRPGKPIPGRNEAYTMYAAILVKQVDAGTRSKTSVNELLRT
jgi:2,3,4,5-tetrahydropyridine-2-carboxylate N-succinyltransferase